MSGVPCASVNALVEHRQPIRISALFFPKPCLDALDLHPLNPHKAPVANDAQATVVSALGALPRDTDRGFTFLSRSREENFLPYGALHDEAMRRAAFLSDLGLKQGDRVALVLPEPYEFVLTFFGALCAGVVPVPVSPRAGFKNRDSYVEVVAHIVRTAEARFVFCMEGNREVLEPLNDVETPMESLLSTDVCFDGDTPSFTPPSIAPDDLCFLQFTSGSTSHPKGVMVTHGNLVTNATSFLGPAGLDRRETDSAVTWLPLFHDMGLIGFVLGTIICDIPTTFIPTETFARSPRLWLEQMTKKKATVTFAPNFAYELVTKRVREKDLADFDLSAVRVAGCGAEPIRARTLQAFADKLAPCGFKSNAFLPSYGMAESTLAISFHQLGKEMIVDKVDGVAMKDGNATPADANTEIVLEIVSCGAPFPGHDLAVVDDAGKRLGERKVGQIVTKGPSVTAGYYKNEEATAEGWKGGWLQTGDLGYFADDNLYICGRIKDLIIIRGKNHYPQDIEWAVADIEGVRRGNVVAFSVIKDGNEELVVAAESHSGDAARLRDEIAKTVMNQFSLATSHVSLTSVGTLPKTSSGKAQRRKTKAMYEDGTLKEHP